MQREYTEDSIYRDEIRILQPSKGYRFAIDAILLAQFIRAETSDRLLEIGAGTGIITILLFQMQPIGSIDAIEVQKELAELCRINFDRNRLKNARVHELDVKDIGSLFEQESFDLVYSNPPYRKKGSGKLNPSEQKAIARHEIRMKLEDVFQCARKLLKPTGRMSLILPFFREKDYHRLLNDFQMHLMECRFVHSFKGQPPAFVLVTASKIGGSPVYQHPPLVLYDSPGRYTKETEELLWERQL